MNARSKHFRGWFLIAAMLLTPGLLADTAPVAEDAHIDLGNPNDNNGVVPNLVVSNIVERRTGERLTFVSYELPALPAGASLEQAWLRLFVGKVAESGDIDLYLVTEAWDEHGLLGMTAPGFEAAPFATFPVAPEDEGHFLSIDVTPEAQAWLSGAEPNHGFVLVANPATDVDVSFDSKENGQTSHHSELELVLGTATGGVDSDDIADGSIGQSDVDKDAVQLRVTGACWAGSSIREIDNMGGVVCEQDDDTFFNLDADSGGGLYVNDIGLLGDIPQVRVGIEPGGVISAMIADQTIVGNDVDATSIQLRVDESCPSGSSIRAISSSGGVTCEVDDDTDTTLDPGLFWQVDGNAGTSPIPGGTNFLGTTDDTELVLGANGTQAMRFTHYNTGGIETVNILGGHSSNSIMAPGGTIGGGGVVLTGGGPTHQNKVEGSFGTIGGGAGNIVSGSDFFFFQGGFVGGGAFNTAYIGASIAGGTENLAAGFESAVHGGFRNSAHGPQAFVGAGIGNGICDPDVFPPDEFPVTEGRASAIAGGQANKSCGYASFIGGGLSNRAVGENSMVIGGLANEARGDYSLASGREAIAMHEGAFVWADSNFGAFESERENQFRVRAFGGVRFDVGDDAETWPGGNQWVDIRTQALNTLGNNSALFRLIDTSTGAYLSLGGGWVNSSDRNRKTDIRDVDANWILEQIAAMPIQSWRYKVEGEDIRHIGPMAQDFHAAFGLGGDPKGIMSVDADGVALAAIQALYRVTQELGARTQQLEEQQQRLDQLETSLQALEARMDPFVDQRLVRAEISLESH